MAAALVGVRSARQTGRIATVAWETWQGPSGSRVHVWGPLAGSEQGPGPLLKVSPPHSRWASTAETRPRSAGRHSLPLHPKSPKAKKQRGSRHRRGGGPGFTPLAPPPPLSWTAPLSSGPLEAGREVPPCPVGHSPLCRCPRPNHTGPSSVPLHAGRSGLCPHRFTRRCSLLLALGLCSGVPTTEKPSRPSTGPPSTLWVLLGLSAPQVGIVGWGAVWLPRR